MNHLVKLKDIIQPDPTNLIIKSLPSTRLTSSSSYFFKLEHATKNQKIMVRLLRSTSQTHPQPLKQSFNRLTQPINQQLIVPINTKAPIPSFYENLDGHWVLSDNWNLYGLSGSNQRHRARSLDQAPNQPQTKPTTSPLIHHASALNPPPSLQYQASPPNNSSSASNNQKLYLPAGWNHTSKRGPLYATSVIVVASLLIAIAVFSTVVCLVTRRRARARRRAQLQQELFSTSDHPSQPNHSTSKLSPADIEEGRVSAILTKPHKKSNNRLNHKLNQLTLVKIIRAPRGKTHARISRISLLAGKPNDPPPPSLIIVGEARRSTSFNSNSSFRCTGERDALSRRRTHSHRTESQGDETPSSEPNSSSHPTLNGLLGIPSHRKPSSVSTFTPAQFPPGSALPNSESSTAGPSTTVRAVQSEAELASRYQDRLVSRTHSARRSDSGHLTTSRPRQHPAEGSAERPPLTIQTADPMGVSTLGRQPEAGRTSVDRNYRSCREIIRARSSTSSSHRAPLVPSSPTSLPDLNCSIPPLPIDIYEPSMLPHRTTRTRSQSIEPSTISRPALARTLANHLVDNTVDPLPPAYSGRTITTAMGESSRASEKQRMSPSLDRSEDPSHPRRAAEELGEEHEAHRPNSALIHQNLNPAPFVAHVATDDKLVLRTLLRMGSTPAMGSRTRGEKEQALEDEVRNEEGSHRSNIVDQDPVERVVLGRDPRGSRGEGGVRRRQGLAAPSAPPLVADEEDEDPMAMASRSEKSNHPQQPTLDDRLVGQNSLTHDLLPAPPAQFIIRFDPSSSTAIEPLFVPDHPTPAPLDPPEPVHTEVLASAPPLTLRDSLSLDNDRHDLLVGPSHSAPLTLERDYTTGTVSSIAPPYVE